MLDNRASRHPGLAQLWQIVTMNGMPDPATVSIPETIEENSTGTSDGLEARVTVYNCNCHTYQQVIQLFCEVIPGMNPAKAFELAWRIDHEGSAVVYQGEWKTAEGIAKHLAGGGLRVALQ